MPAITFLEDRLQQIDRLDRGVLCACGCGLAAPIASRTNKAKGAVRGRPQRYVAGHNKRGTSDLGRYVVEASGCWLWAGSFNRKGYGRIQIGGIHKNAHRGLYEAAFGELPRSLHLDHLCRNKRCVNPSHMEPVTAAENNRRKRMCALDEAS